MRFSVECFEGSKDGILDGCEKIVMIRKQCDFDGDKYGKHDKSELGLYLRYTN